MDDRAIMENLLLTTKGACDLYLHGTIESSSPNVHQVFDRALDESISLQDNIYKRMSAKGWYTTDEADKLKIQKLKNQYAMM